MQDPTSLDRLHDIVLPPAVSWWPPAPGWYVLSAVLLLATAWYGWWQLRCWRATAYRREALRELATLQDAAEMAQLLRRTALAVAPRDAVAAATGDAWLQWLAQRGPEAPPTVREALTVGVYASPTAASRMDAAALPALRDYCRRWILQHEAGRRTA